MFKEYQHIERIGTEGVEGINNGTCYVFPKIDGTNSSIWLEGGTLHFGSHHRELSLEKDNAGFMADTLKNEELVERLMRFFNAYPNAILFGEWLVPHSLKTYRKNAWRKLYIFDVCISLEEGFRYLPYEEYKGMLDEYDLEYIPCVKVLVNPSVEDFYKILDENTYLVEDGKGAGEGIVIKNYDYRNKWGRLQYGKIVRSEFKDIHRREMGCPKAEFNPIEKQIADKYITNAYCEKELHKIITERGGWENKDIPMLLNTIYHELITEEMWNIVKQFKNPTIDFKRLQVFVYDKVKEELSFLF